MFRRKLGAALVAALPLLLAAGCGSPTSAYVPVAKTAREDLDTALASWRKGGKPSQLMTGDHPIYFVDTEWESGLALESYEIGEEGAADSETEKRYKAVLKLRKAGADAKKPAAEKQVEFVAVGRSPMWIFRDEDYKRQGSMGEEPKAKTGGRRPGRGR